ncbi:MAG: T9SS type A sorting domain-containing protein [Bacteroidia bacterium]|nr:T9SS type A sorting domain-containing protein [Bacteroidia bacterium]
MQLPYQDEELCLVSVDTVLWKNKVMWSKTQDVGTISYNIYKETGLNEFSLLGNVPISQSSVFIDYSSAPESHGDKYKITAIDTCWAESELSYYHKTMNLTVAVNGATMGLNWDDYIDESGSYVPSKFYIFRGSTPTNIAMYDSISATFHSYNDYNVLDSYYYMVAVKKAGGCNTNKTGENDFSFSNKRLNFTGIEEIENPVNLNISPNPFCDKTIIIFDNSKNNFNYLILSDITGKEILRITDISSGKVEIEKGDLAPGVYFVEISGNNVLREKLVIE